MFSSFSSTKLVTIPFYILQIHEVGHSMYQLAKKKDKILPCLLFWINY